MAGTPTAPSARDLEAVRQRLERWRARCPHRRAAIPEPLWAAAVALARQDGLYRTARTLRLGYASLKQRLEAAGGVGPASGAPTFVELAPAPPPGLGACVIELQGPGSRTLRIHLNGLALPDLLALSREVWSGG